MDNPLNLPVPPDSLERIHDLARDLAYGVIHKLWSGAITIRNYGYTNEEIAATWGDDYEMKSIDAKWQDQRPSLQLLDTFGYLKLIQEEASSRTYELSQKAFSLLERPAIVPSVFISYSRKTSSTFGLLIECRLKSAGIDAFIDRSLDPGNEWHRQLEETLARCNRFICLIAAGTLASPYVCEEIEWAKTQNILTIPIWQPSFTPTEAVYSTEIRDFVVSKHSIRVLEESAEAYYNATEALLNRLGYSGI